MNAGAKIAAQVNAALAQAGRATGQDEVQGVITRAGTVTGPQYAPETSNPEDHTFTLILGEFSERERKGTQIKDTDVKITAGISTIAPEKGDTIVTAAIKYRIEGVKTRRPGGVDLKHTLWAREIGPDGP